MFGAVFYLLGLISLIFKTPLFAEDCAFCMNEVLERQSFYEDEQVIALYTYKPVLPPHFLIIPKRHVERFEELTDEEMVQIGRAIKKVHLAAGQVFGTSSYLLLQKNGREVGQSVPHVHFHYIARENGDDSTLKFLFKFLIADLYSPLPYENIRLVADKMQEAIEVGGEP